jgi:hypothetical protein
MIRDPIVQEIREVRRKTEEACEGDWNRLIEHYRQVQNAATLPVFRGSPKRLASRPESDESRFPTCPSGPG